MYAVIRSGGKQERVAEGQRVRVELLGQPIGAEVSLEPVLVVDGGTVLATPEQLAGASVTAKVVGSELGPKINAMTYKSKSNQRRRWGHRQHYAQRSRSPRSPRPAEAGNPRSPTCRRPKVAGRPATAATRRHSAWESRSSTAPR